MTRGPITPCALSSPRSARGRSRVGRLPRGVLEGGDGSSPGWTIPEAGFRSVIARCAPGVRGPRKGAADMADGEVPAEVPALRAARAGKRYGRRWALRECTFSIPRGRVAALVGPNGAGKSTVLHLASGLVRADAGRVLVFGESPH